MCTCVDVSDVSVDLYICVNINVYLCPCICVYNAFIHTYICIFILCDYVQCCEDIVGIN